MTKHPLISVLTLFFLSIILFASCNRTSDSFQISGKLENVIGNYFFISYEKGDSVFLDTVAIDQKGEFSYKKEIDHLTVLSLYFNDNTRNTFVLADKGWNVKIKGDLLFSDLLEIKGGDVNDNITEFKNKNKELLSSRAKILNATEKRINDNDSIIPKDYVADLKNINFELSNVAEAYIQSHPDQIASAMLLNIFFKDETSIPRLEENLALLRGKAADFSITHELNEYVKKIKSSSAGATAPLFSLKNNKGETVNISTFRGKYVLLTFASTTCSVCIDEKKDAVSVYEQLKKEKRNIEFITIVKDIEQEPLSKAITDSVKWDLLPVEGGWAAKPFVEYNINEMPYNILISPSNQILERDIHILALPKKMEELSK
ncbi:DUF4369 domain-containing protein [Dysgonomonas sp. Marseille-P4361]|uniref:DUF4369 domain-containing protein n=1 Tax=Dysgonomonas sp. Marseille-P4361 TaxID=2161820 RepID=UPI000D54FDE9|nr:DUF4369 domain-containing protein [Dysgonomonas sp. Marseille-P4361]